jgi:hypothetical protein
MGQHCFRAEQEGDGAKTKSGGSKSSPKGAAATRPEATKFSYQLPSARRDKQDPPFTASRNPDDYAPSGLQNQTWLRLPGQINDQRINIENARHATFLLLDNCDSVQVDDCADCTFYIGPTMGSVFLRGCINCKCVILCGQLRLRDVKNTQIALLCRSRPVVESSRHVGIGCFVGPQYLDLRWQMARASLSAWNNLYYNVHDFTPHPESWHPLTQAECAALVPTLALLTDGSYFTEAEEKIATVVPWIAGPQPRAPYVCVLGAAGYQEEMESLMLEIAGSAKAKQELFETTEFALTEEHVTQMSAAVPELKGKLRLGDIHTFFCLSATSSAAQDQSALAAREGVLAVVRPDAGAIRLREAITARAGADSGFGNAF